MVFLHHDSHADTFAFSSLESMALGEAIRRSDCHLRRLSRRVQSPVPLPDRARPLSPLSSPTSRPRRQTESKSPGPHCASNESLPCGAAYRKDPARPRHGPRVQIPQPPCATPAPAPDVSTASERGPNWGWWKGRCEREPWKRRTQGVYALRVWYTVARARAR